MPRTPSNAARRKLLGDVNNFPARSRMQLLHQCLPLSRVLGSLHRMRPQRPSPRLGLRLAYRLHLSPILVGQRTALPDEYVPAGQPINAAEILAARTNDDSQQTRSLVAATQLRMERLPAAPSPQLISLDAAADGAAEPPSTTARRPTALPPSQIPPHLINNCPPSSDLPPQPNSPIRPRSFCTELAHHPVRRSLLPPALPNLSQPRHDQTH